LNKKKGHVRKALRKPVAKAKKHIRREKPAVHTAKPARKMDSISPASPKPVSLTTQTEHRVERPSFKIIIDRIDGGTVLGDLMVVFPRTREVLKKYGLNLEVEEAGDIYMSLEAFAALKGLKTESVIEELEVASKETPSSPAVPPIAVSTVA